MQAIVLYYLDNAYTYSLILKQDRCLHDCDLMQGDTVAAARMTDAMWRVQRHLRVTAFALKDTDCSTFHAVSDSFPVVPDLQVPFSLFCFP